MKTVFLFPGQGAQYFQMGRELFEACPEFRSDLNGMDEIVRGLTGHSVIEALYAPDVRRSDIFDRLLLTNPAIFMVELGLARLLIERGATPDIVLGASLGTFVAATVAGMLEPEEALESVVRLARLVEDRCEEGAMIAVLAPDSLQAIWPLSSLGTVASCNFDGHFVLSCRDMHVDSIEDFLRARAIAFQRLPVRFAFHSVDIDPARDAAMQMLSSLRMLPARIPLACCRRGTLVDRMTAEDLWLAARAPILFSTTIANLERRGAWRYLDIGPTDTLATFVKYTLAENSTSRFEGVLSAYGRSTAWLAKLTGTGTGSIA